jgi:hypothetical protein
MHSVYLFLLLNLVMIVSTYQNYSDLPNIRLFSENGYGEYGNTMTCLGTNCLHSPPTIRCNQINDQARNYADLVWECEALLEEGYDLMKIKLTCNPNAMMIDPRHGCALQYQIQGPDRHVPSSQPDQTVAILVIAAIFLLCAIAFFVECNRVPMATIPTAAYANTHSTSYTTSS